MYNYNHVASVLAPDPNLGGALQAYQGWRPCIEWCEQYFPAEIWRYDGEGVFKFLHAEDLTLFMLRWS
jgi:hypothetical protein